MHANAPHLLHRDGAGFLGQYVAATVWLDPFDTDNGATQIVAASRRDDCDPATEAFVLTGDVGDILLFDPAVLHGATTNQSNARRRSLLIFYAAVALRDQHKKTEALQYARIETSETFA